MGDDQGGVGEGGQQRSELLEVLGRLEDPAGAAAEPLEDLEDGAEVLVGRGLVAGAVRVAPRGDERGGLEEHGRDVDGEELDLLVDVVDGHLVHPLEVRQGRVQEFEGRRRARPAGIGSAGGRAFGVGQDGFDALPVGQGAEARVGGDEVVEMGRPRAGEAGDDDGAGDLDVVDLGMPVQDVADQEPVLDQPDELAVPGDDARAAQSGLGAKRGAEDLQAVQKRIVVAGVVEARLGARRGEDLPRPQRTGGRHLRHGLAELLDLGRKPGRGQIVEDDGRRTGHRSPGSAPVVTRAEGRGGVSSGRNHRNQIRPRGCPAVEIQLGWPGSRGATTRRQEPSGS